MQLLWAAIAHFVFHHDIALMFGCASLHGVDPESLALPLSYLHHFHLAPEEMRPVALPHLHVGMDFMPPDDINKKAAVTALPPLLKGYLRLGGFVGDGAVVEFMKVGAPDYMWHGIVSFILLGYLITVALIPDRFRVHRNYPSFKYWHRVLAIIAIGTATYHIVVSNFYLGTWYQGLLFAALAVAVAFGRIYWVKLGQLPIANTGVYLVVSILFAAAFTALRNLPA